MPPGFVPPSDAFSPSFRGYRNAPGLTTIQRSHTAWPPGPLSVRLCPNRWTAMRTSLKRVVIAAAVLGWAPGALAQTIKVGSKNFTEQFIVAELYAASLEAAGFKVERKINLGATLIAHQAIKAGAIDVYPEYTGTGLVAVMKIEGSPEKDPQSVYQRVKTFYETNFNLTWLTPSRVDNGNAIVVRPETASQYGLKTLSDLGRAAGKLTL